MSDSVDRLQALIDIAHAAMIMLPVDLAAYMRSLRAMDRNGFITAAQAEEILQNPGAHPGEPGSDTSIDYMVDVFSLWEEHDDGTRYRVAGWWLTLDPPEDSAASRVYFVRVGAAGPIKIGRSGDVPKRLASLQVANPEPLRVLATMHGGARVERMLHEEFRRDRLQGEWFRPSPELLDFIREVGGAP